MNRYFQRTTILQFGLIGILAGLILAKIGFSTTHTLILVGFLLAPMIPRAKILALVAFLFIGLNIGLWRGANSLTELNKYQKFKDQKVTLIGKVDNDSAYSERGQLEFRISDIMEESTGTKLPGVVRVRGFNAPSVIRADQVKVTGKLRGPFGSLQGFMSFADVAVIARSDSVLEKIRSKYFAGVFSSLSEPGASLGLGFLVGTRTLLPEALLTALSITGLTHIVAVSGYNLTILVRMMRRLFAKQSVYMATASSIALIIGFLLVTGFSPSIIRASVVSILALLSWYYGRIIKPTVLLLTAAVLTSIYNPYYIWFDVGWYLSFSAFAGVLILAPLISRRLFKKKPKIFGQILIETTCAQIMTLPIIAVIFGQISLISVLANLLVLPLIPLAMFTTFVAGIAGMFVPHISGWLAWPAEFLLGFIVDIIKILSNVSWALKPVEMSWIQLGLIYGFILLIIIVLWQKTKSLNAINAAEVIE